MEIILGSAVSLIVQFVKNKFGTSEYVTIGAALALSVVAAVVYTGLVAANLWESVLQVILTAGAFYTFIIQRFE
jgi:multisubunit Na+/H+ antiporter MnhE subunit